MTRASPPRWCTPAKRSKDPEPSLLQEPPELHIQPRKRAKRLSKTELSLIVDPQSSCPFFYPQKGLPLEIRNIIFRLALTTYEDTTKEPKTKTQPFITHLSCHTPRPAEPRPGHFYPRRTDTALLHTCQLIYSEARLEAVAVNTHFLWYTYFRLTIGFPLSTNAPKPFRLMTSEQLAAVQHVHIFAKSRRLYSVFDEYVRMRGSSTGKSASIQLCGPYPQTLTITLGYTGWAPVSLDLDEHMLRNEHWKNVFSGLRTLRMELEVAETKQEYFKPVIKYLKDYTFDIGDGEVLVAEQNVKDTRWTGGQNMGSYSCPDWKETEVFVTTITWGVRTVATRLTREE